MGVCFRLSRGKANGGIRTCNPWFTEPENGSSKPLIEKGLTSSPENGLADCLAAIAQTHRDLVELIEAWPRLLEDTCVAILRIVGQ